MIYVMTIMIYQNREKSVHVLQKEIINDFYEYSKPHSHKFWLTLLNLYRIIGGSVELPF